MTEWELFATCFSIAFCPKSMSQYSTKLGWHAITRSAVQSASFFADMAHQSHHITGRAICENMPLSSYLCVCRAANGELLLPLCDFVVIIVYRSANGDWLASRTVILIDFVSVSANGDLLLSLMHCEHVVANFSFVSVSDLVTYVAFCFFVIAIIGFQ